MTLPLAELPQAIFDTGIIFGATFAPTGIAAKVVQLMVRGEVAVTVSNRLRAEYDRIVTHPGNLNRFAVSLEYAVAVLDLIDQYAERIPNPPTVMHYARDPNDEPLINLAVAVKADYLVTLDNDLLDLPQHPGFAGLPHQPQILKPGAFIAAIELRRN
jgi:putative PIN family toxin of toxin-antitoxin system